jgi:TRAP-type mannitol/chloroaromatic compound transport system substrate-binding protein
MKEFVKIKVTDVLKLFAILERDINELSNTNQSISDNRDYSYTLKKSISDEILKLKAIKDSILELEVDIPKSIYTRNQTEEKSFKNLIEDITSTPTIENKTQEISETPPQKKERKVHRY